MLAILGGQAAPITPLAAQITDAQNTDKDAKTDKSRPAKQLESQKADKDAPAQAPPGATALDEIKLPRGAILVLIETLKDAAQYGKMYLMAPQDYQALMDKVRLLEQQLKPERGSVHACKLSGRIDGDYVALRAEFTFSTPQPRMAVPLGLQGAHLVDEGDLDGAAPLLEHGDEGFVVRVEKEGPHRLGLNLKVPLTQRRSGLLGAASERGFEVGLPGAPAETLTLEMPAAIKDIRVNDAIRKSKSPGRWELTFALAKQLTVTWKEPQAVLGAGALPSLDAQVTVRVEETFAQVKADLTLEDPRGQTKDWPLLLPSGAVATVKSLGTASHQWIPPDAKNPYHILRLREPTSERLSVAVQTSVPRPVNRVAVGPFALAGSFRSQGTIRVEAGPQALAGQRIVYHRFGEVVQRDVAKEDALASFQFAAAPGGKTPSKAPLELEFQPSPSLVETQTEHTVRLLGNGAGWQIETTSRITAKALADSADFLDVHFPSVRLPRLGILGAMPALPFPATVPWSLVVPGNGADIVWAMPGEFRWEQDGQARVAEPGTPARIRWRSRGAKQLVVTVYGRYHVASGANRLRLELPRPQTMLDRGGALSVSGGDDIEFLVGPRGAEEPAPERNRYRLVQEALPTHIDLAWRRRDRDFAVATIADVTIQEAFAQVRQTLRFTMPTRAAGPTPVQLRLPPEIEGIVIVSGGKAVRNEDADAVFVVPIIDATGHSELVIDYEVPLAPKAPDEPARRLETALVWPEGATHHEAKVRVWCRPGSFAEVGAVPGAWRDRGVEVAPDRDSVPALVIQSTGAETPLALRVHDGGAAKLATLVCERTLAGVRLDDEGNQHYRVRYLVRKLTSAELNIELPVSARENLLSVRLGTDKKHKALPWDDPVWNVAHVAIPPELTPTKEAPAILELEYKVPADEAAGPWQSTLQPPRFHGEVLIGAVRWHVELPRDPVAVVLGGSAHLDYRWTLHGWLFTPATNITSADLESWLTGKDLGGSGNAANAGGNADAGNAGEPALAFWRNGTAPVYLLHLPRPIWLFVCSSLVLGLGLGLYLLPLGRLGLALASLTISLAVLAVALWWPATLPPVLLGSQPGLAVLVLLLGVQWLAQERYRRQVVFLPGFTRLQSSSLMHEGRKPREPSTIDAPPTAVGAGPGSVK